MKKFLSLILFVALLVTTGVVYAEDANTPEAGDKIELSEAVIPCMVTGDRVRERKGPSTDYDVVCKHRKGEIVNVIDATGDWWKLLNGNYMSAQYLEPMCSNDVDPDVEFLVEEPEAEPEVAPEVEPEAAEEPVIPEDAKPFEVSQISNENIPRVFQMVCARRGATKEAVVELVPNCVIMSTRDQDINCYQNGELKVCISLSMSHWPMYIAFLVKPTDGDCYEVRTAYELMDVIKSYSADYSYFVIVE